MYCKRKGRRERRYASPTFFTLKEQYVWKTIIHSVIT
nr:MAG TPA: hypothetical protein [Caudoviricetes sp.]